MSTPFDAPVVAPIEPPARPSPPPAPPSHGSPAYGPPVPGPPGPARPSPTWRSLAWPDQPAWILPIVALLAVSTDQAIRARTVGLLLTLVLSIAALMTATAGPTPARRRLLPAGLAVAAAGLLGVRQSPLVLTLAIGTSACLLVWAAAEGAGSRATLASALHRMGGGLLRGPRWLGRRVGRRLAPARGRMIARSLAIVGLVGGMLMLVLAGADPVFGAAIGSIRVGSLASRSFSWIGLAVPFSALAYAASLPPDTESDTTSPKQVLEADGVLGVLAIAGVLGAWCTTQVVVAAGGAQHVLESAGLTRAEYARSGFFQLVLATALVLGLLHGLDRLTAPTSYDRWFALGVIVVAVETVALVAATGRRLMLYTDAFGLTLTRVAVAWFLAWLAIVIVTTSVGIVQRRLGTAVRLSPTAGARVAAYTAAVMVIGFGWWNPEARIVEVNLARADAGATIDLAYLASLSPDGLVALGNATLTDDADSVPLVARAICDADQPGPWWNPSWSLHRLGRLEASIAC